MAKVRTMVVFQGRSNMPEDVFVNTFYFDTGALSLEAASAGITGLMENFYDVNDTVYGKCVSNFLSRYIDPSKNQFRLYDMADPLPRTPLIVPWSGNIGDASTNDLPEEVACCLSFHGSAPITKRRRGRVYIGPLNTNALKDDLAPGTSPSRPSAALMNVLRDAGKDLQSAAALGPIDWVIHSSVPAVNYVPVAGGFVNDAFDTQRRRGVDPTMKLIFPVSP